MTHEDKSIDSFSADSAELVSELARETRERHEQVQREVQRETPPFLREVEQSEVLYTLPPRMIPLANADYAALSRALSSKWDLALDEEQLNLGSILSEVPREQIGSLSQDELMQRLLRARQPALGFKNGKYQVSDFEFIRIISVRLTRESVVVGVAGISQVAEVVASEVIEAVWASAGAAKAWTSIEPHVQRKGYATRTTIDLGMPAEQLLLSNKLRDFVENEMIEGKKYAAAMGYFYARDGFAPPSDAVSVFALDDLFLRFVRFDLPSGESTPTQMQFRVMAASDYTQGIVSVSSELPYDLHIEVLEELLAALRDAPDE